MKKRRIVSAVLAMLACLALPAVSAALPRVEACGGEAPKTSASEDLRITPGVNASRAWLTAQYGDLHVRKFTQRGGASVFEFRDGDDVVVFSLAPGSATVTRGSSTYALGIRESVSSVQQLLAASPAMFRARIMLSRLEGTSKLEAPEMSLLSVVAFAATLTGDTGAPLRLADRFMARHHGIIRPIRFSCWSSYSSEVNSAWNDYESCITEADQGSALFAYIREQACVGTWVLRSESAWFEYLTCLSPLSAIKSED
jgi:hypothetical protein